MGKVKKLKTGFRSNKGPWQGSDKIYITVRGRYITAASLRTKAGVYYSIILPPTHPGRSE